MVGTSLSMGLGFLVIPRSEDFGVSTSDFLIYYSVFTLFTAIAASLAGRVVLRRGIRFVVSSFGLLAVIGLILMSISPILIMFYASAAVFGLGWGGSTLVSANVIVNNWWAGSKRKGSVLGWVMASVGIGGFIWGIVMPPIVSGGGGRAGLIFITVGVAVLIFLSGVLLVKDPPIIQKKTSEVDAASTKIRGLVAIVTVLLVFASFVIALESGITQTLPSVFNASGLDATQAGLLVSIWAILGIVIKPLMGWVHDRFGALLFVSACMIVGFPMIIIAEGFWAYAASLPFMTIATATVTVVFPLITSAAVGPERFPTVYGATLTAMYLGLAAGVPVVWGLTFDQTGSFNLALWLSLTFTVIAVILMWAARKYGLGKQQNAGIPAKESVPVAS